MFGKASCSTDPLDSSCELFRHITLSFPVLPAPWIAPSPPTAATDPDAAREMFERDVVFVESAVFGCVNTFAVFKDEEFAVRNPARINAAKSASGNNLAGIIGELGFSVRYCQNLASFATSVGNTSPESIHTSQLLV